MGLLHLIKKYKWLIRVASSVDKVDRKNLIKGYKQRRQYYTSPYQDFNVNLKDMAKCATCPNMCRFDCPSLQLSKIETFSPANKARIGLFMGMGRIPLENLTAQDTMYACMNCGACREWCPMDINTGDLLKEMRCELEKRDLIPDRIHGLKNNIESTGSVFKVSPYLNSKFEKSEIGVDVFYYIGCMDIKYRPESISATISLLKHLGLSYTTNLNDRVCCGGPVNKVGYASVAQKLAKKNIDLINKSEAKIILTTCPGCLETLKLTYKDEFSIEGSIKNSKNIIHAIDFFLEKIQSGKLKLIKPVEKTVVYHDPCILSRSFSKVNNTTNSRILFNLIPGITLVEPYLSKNETQCCGMGGGYHVSNIKNSTAQSVIRYDQLNKTYPEIIVSGCPTCEYALIEGQLKSNAKTGEDLPKIYDIVELLAISARLDY